MNDRRLMLWRIAEASGFAVSPSQIERDWTDQDIKEFWEYQKYRAHKLNQARREASRIWADSAENRIKIDVSADAPEKN